jgi:tetratricopeptide (TPR) repeat protein
VLLLAGSAGVTGVLYASAQAARARAEAGEARAAAAAADEASQRARAEENFRAVRGLARTMIVGFNRDIEDLRGATPARERLVTEALAYLRRVKDQAAGDPDFALELADAYDAVGDIQAGLHTPHVGGSVSAEGSFAEARRLRESARAARPGDPLVAAGLARSLKRSAGLLRVQRNYAPSVRELEAALAMIDGAVASMPDGEPRRRAMDQREHIRLDLADTLRLLASADAAHAAREDEAVRLYDRVIEAWTARVEASPEDADAVRALGVALDQRAQSDLSLANRRRSAAEALREKGRPAEALPALRATVPMYERARDASLAAEATFERLAAARPQSAALARNRHIALHNAGDASMRLGYAWGSVAECAAGDERSAARAASAANLEAALALYRRGLAIAESLWESDESNLEAERWLAVMLNKAGTVLVDLKRWDESAGFLDRSLRVRRDIFRTDATHQHRRDLAQAQVKRAILTRERLAAGAGGADAEAMVRDARALLEAALDHFDVLVKAGVMAEASREIAAARSTLEAVRAHRPEEAEAPAGAGTP